MLNKLIYSFFISIFVGIIASILSLTINIKILNSIFMGVVISNTIIIGIYIPDMIENNNKDLDYVIGYTILCIIFYLFYIPFIIIKNNKNCYFKCKCCKSDDYDLFEKIYDGA